ncbi:MAG TPA: hypothetical protein VHV10_16220, partial [Ktedonobacteraceae bacterium]|nr:hypothetical protein [Ktedonobacteraceae bacterium]
EKDQVTILELTDQELEGISGGRHHDSGCHESDREDRRFGDDNRRRFGFDERFSFRESFRFSRRDCD